MTLSLKYVHSLLVRMKYFIWEKWLEDGWIFYMVAKPGVFLPKENYQQFTAISSINCI